jgi:hypothetical protein
MKNFCSAKDTAKIHRLEEDICKIQIWKRLVHKTYKEHLKLNNRKIMIQFKRSKQILYQRRQRDGWQVHP